MLLDWVENPCPVTFPYGKVLQAVRRQGKHFIDTNVLAALEQARCTLARTQTTDHALLNKFLDVVLDKYDNKYNYLSYIGLPLLEHEHADLTDTASVQLSQHVHDVTVAALIGDALRFELECLSGEEGYLSAMRPDAKLLERRLSCALRSIEPSLLRLGFGAIDEDTPSSRNAELIVRFCSRQPLAHPPFVLDISMMPVYVVHDEHLFIRILQALDATFVSVSGLLRCALRACDEQPPLAANYILAGNSILQEGLKHFLTLSTMQKEAFSAFREFTTGASAIQSVNYKIMESLCRNPEPERLDSVAYASVPTLQQQLRAGHVSLDEKLIELRCRSDVASQTLVDIEAAMLALSETLTRWRHAHYGIAKKYIGDGTGTGYTAGTPYLKMVKDLPVFTTVTPGKDSASRH